MPRAFFCAEYHQRPPRHMSIGSSSAPKPWLRPIRHHVRLFCTRARIPCLYVISCSGQYASTYMNIGHDTTFGCTALAGIINSHARSSVHSSYTCAPWPPTRVKEQVIAIQFIQKANEDAVVHHMRQTVNSPRRQHKLSTSPMPPITNADRMRGKQYSPNPRDAIFFGCCH